MPPGVLLEAACQTGKDVQLVYDWLMLDVGYAKDSPVLSEWCGGREGCLLLLEERGMRFCIRVSCYPGEVESDPVLEATLPHPMTLPCPDFRLLFPIKDHFPEFMVSQHIAQRISFTLEVSFQF